VGSIIGSGAPIGQSINGAVAALQNGSAASLLSGPIGAGGTPLSGLATGLLVFAPEQLALAITPAG
jgi:hypothetical protein